MHAGQELYQLNYIPASSILNVSRLLRILGVGKNKKNPGSQPIQSFQPNEENRPHTAECVITNLSKCSNSTRKHDTGEESYVVREVS